MKKQVLGWTLLSLSFATAQASVQEGGVTYTDKPLELQDIERFLGLTSWKFTYRPEEPFRELTLGVLRFRQNEHGTFDEEVLYGYRGVHFYDEEPRSEVDVTLMYSDVDGPRFSYSVEHAFGVASPVDFNPTGGGYIIYPGLGFFLDGQFILMAQYRDPSKDTDSFDNMLEYVALDITTQ